jgi:hypothetical protein
VKSMYEVYAQFRAEGMAPKPAAESTGRLYGKTSQEEVRQLQVTLEALEARDLAPGAAEPVKIAAGVASYYLQERRAGRSDAEATRLTAHTYGYAGTDLDRQLRRPREQFERELEAWQPSSQSHSLVKETSS